MIISSSKNYQLSNQGWLVKVIKCDYLHEDGLGMRKVKNYYFLI